MFKKIRKLLLGSDKNPLEAGIFHQLSLVALLAWIGLGADGLSSSAYGPEETFRALGSTHTSLALYLTIATALTVFIISASYNLIISQFPAGGGGYVVTSKLLGPNAGVISGSALVIDYMLTIAVSLVSGVDAVFSFLPPAWGAYKLISTCALIVLLIWMNLRGVKESIQVLLPIFAIFLITHAVMILWGIFSHASNMPAIVQNTVQDTQQIVSQKNGFWLLLILLFRAYSMGGGTYTGIEAVSNGMANLREPRVKTGHRTMWYMAFSLAFTAGGILLCYMLWDVSETPGKTMNAVLIERVFGSWGSTDNWMIHTLIMVTLISEGTLLFVAAQAGFLAGPAVLSNMAVDSWIPHRFANLSSRLVRMNGVLLMGLSSLLIVLLTHGNIHILIVLYSINVFLTFSLSQLAMCRHWFQVRHIDRLWLRRLLINGLGLTLTTTVLCITLGVKFFQGGWVTMIITGGFIIFAYVVKMHYKRIGKALKRLDDLLVRIPLPSAQPNHEACDPSASTAVLMVNSYNGLGIHSIFSIRKLFKDKFKNFIFISVGQVDSSRFKGVEELENLKNATQEALDKYVELAQRMGYCSASFKSLGTDVIEEIEKVCDGITKEFSDPIFFVGKLIFAKENLFSKFLHNETAMELQRRLLFKGQNMVIVPIRVL